MRRLLLVRHGRTAWNLELRAQGHADVPLDEVGLAQAEAVAPLVASYGPSRIRSSDLGRAATTAGIIAEASALSVETDERLREFDIGVRSGLTMGEFAEQFPAEYERFLAGDPGAGVDGAETVGDVRARMLAVLTDLWDLTAPGETTVAVGHGGALKAGLLALLDWPPSHMGTLSGLHNCGVAVLEEHDDGSGIRLTAYNLTAPGPGGDPDFASRAGAR